MMTCREIERLHNVGYFDFLLLSQLTYGDPLGFFKASDMTFRDRFESPVPTS